ncbi:MAG: hypothetical protein K0R82_2491, partial [Flavipsychrobacter sp.]|nr:hypothetical protein [Flavipsychrobacter sp.]
WPRAKNIYSGKAASHLVNSGILREWTSPSAPFKGGTAIK